MTLHLTQQDRIQQLRRAPSVNLVSLRRFRR